MDVALVSQQVFGFAEIFRCVAGGREVCDGFGLLTSSQRFSPEREVGAHVLAERLAFAALPGLKLSRRDERECALGLGGLIVERAKLDRKIVALVHELGMVFEFS